MGFIDIAAMQRLIADSVIYKIRRSLAFVLRAVQYATDILMNFYMRVSSSDMESSIFESLLCLRAPAIAL